MAIIVRAVGEPWWIPALAPGESRKAPRTIRTNDIWSELMWSFKAGKRALLAAAAVMGIISAGSAFAAEPNAEKGAQISSQCAACHGSDGMSVDTSIPNLAGQHYAYLLAQTNAFRDRTRINPIMNQMVQSLTQEQIEDIAAYYASVAIQVKAAPKPKH
jgi:cytochrome c553